MSVNEKQTANSGDIEIIDYDESEDILTGYQCVNGLSYIWIRKRID